eukprot:gene26629-4232_t
MLHLARATCGSQALSRRATLCHIRPMTPACPPHPAPTRTFGSSTNTIRYGRLYWNQKSQCSAQQNGSGSVTGRDGALPDPLIGPYDGWVDGVYCLEMGVRDYELDQFGVVNNAVYANYFQHAIHEGLERLGIDCDAYARENLGLAITDMRLSYKAPLRSKDKFRVLAEVSRVTGARAVMDKVILKSVTNGDGSTSAGSTPAGSTTPPAGSTSAGSTTPPTGSTSADSPPPTGSTSADSPPPTGSTSAGSTSAGSTS